MNEKKMTKKDYFNAIKEIIEGTDSEIKGELIYFIESQIASIDNKAEKAKERAAAKKADEGLRSANAKGNPVDISKYESYVLEDAETKLDP